MTDDPGDGPGPPSPGAPSNAPSDAPSDAPSVPASPALPGVLPDDVRRQLVELAAAVLGEITEAEAPVPLRRVRGFAPARRARAGAAPLAVALEREPAFRQRVAAAWRASIPFTAPSHSLRT